MILQMDALQDMATAASASANKHNYGVDTEERDVVPHSKRGMQVRL
jgi:hypothetical protein